MGILGVDDLSGDAPLMEAGLDSLCLDSLKSHDFLWPKMDSKLVGWLAGWLARGVIYRVLGHVWLFLYWWVRTGVIRNEKVKEIQRCFI